ncbi:DMT family transporter [Pseudodesulfovibrio senegalensis]|uniref:EamA family transporter n=1 Tax=Pseudodesulfovibrio senegalensis TaxID=1721087 RepID=A0A6N6N1G6_9BACT|nr:EamA family transporter [Pseudodesulfovibrio senegalensis]KAB1440383.1 EamA family transporter [Pseudodesulfovibrio senegalensis]
MDVRGLCYVLAAAFMWGIIGIFTKYILKDGVSALEIAFWRAAFAWVLFLIHATAKKQLKVKTVDLTILVGFGFICVTLFYASYQLAIRDVGVALAAVLLYTAPAWVAFLSRLVLGEALTPSKIACVAMTIGGVACISLGPSLFDDGPAVRLDKFGLAAGLVAGLTYALYYIFGKKILHRYATPTIFVYALPFGALFLLPFVHFAPKTPQTWMLLASMAAVTSYGAFSAYYAGLKRLDATHAAVIATLEPVVASIMAFTLFGESFGVWGYGGSTLIIAAVLIVVMGGGRPATRKTQMD